MCMGMVVSRCSFVRNRRTQLLTVFTVPCPQRFNFDRYPYAACKTCLLLLTSSSHPLPEFIDLNTAATAQVPPESVISSRWIWLTAALLLLCMATLAGAWMLLPSDQAQAPRVRSGSAAKAAEPTLPSMALAQGIQAPGESWQAGAWGASTSGGLGLSPMQQTDVTPQVTGLADGSRSPSHRAPKSGVLPHL